MPWPKDKQEKFKWLEDTIQSALVSAGVDKEVEFTTDQYNNTMKIYFETTEQWDAKTERWRVWDEDENRWADEEPAERLVTWPVYAHSSKDSNYESALEAGLTTDEISKYEDILYIGYEIEGTAELDRETGKLIVTWETK